MKTRAFTLIELLAVIIILGILSVLIVPKVVSMLDEAEKNTNMTSAQNLVKAAEYKISNNQVTGRIENKKINYKTGENINYLDYTGEKPQSGQVTIKSNGRIAMAVRFGDYCYIKSYNESNISIITYNENTCGENADVFVNYEIPNLANSGDGLYEAQGEPGRLIYKGANPNNYISLKENNINTLYRIISYEKDGTIKVIRDDSIGEMAWDSEGTRNSTVDTYCTTASTDGCNAWGNQTNTYNNNNLLSTEFYYNYYENNTATAFTKTANNVEVTVDSSLNTYLNNEWLNSIDLDEYIESKTFNVGGIHYFGNYEGGDKGILKEKEEEKNLTWNGKIGLMNITEFVETSTDSSCNSVYSNYKYNYPNFYYADEGTTQKTEHVPADNNYPCRNNNWTYKSYVQWSLSSYSYSRRYIWVVDGGTNYFNGNRVNNTYGVRPTFYLKSSVILDGLGTKGDPYYIVES